MTTTGYTNYRGFLRDHLVERKKKNPQFSLRSFARSLGVQPAFLSYVLNGKRDLSDEMIAQFAERLDLSERDTKVFELLVKIERTKNAALKKRLLDSLNELEPSQSMKRDLTVDQFMMISEWYHFALFMLLDIASFKWTSAAAAKALNISTFEVEQALERMISLELISYEPGTRPIKIEKRILIETKTNSDAVKKYNFQILAKTKESLENLKPSERYTGTETLILSHTQMDEAAQIFEECFQKIIALSHRAEKDQEVFSVGIHLFPLTQTKPQGVKK